jgi:Ca-activated chloride channel family protein
MRVVRAGGALPAKAGTRCVQFITVLFLIMALVLLAGRSPRAESVRLKDVESGSLLLQGANAEPGAFIAAPLVKTHVRMEVSGLIARVTVSQLFLNPSDEQIEGVYVFPLPENAAVDRLRLQIGERFIEGKMRERAEARAIYDAARATEAPARPRALRRPTTSRNQARAASAEPRSPERRRR